MNVHITARTPDLIWEHHSVTTAATGALRLRRRGATWSLSGRGGRVTWDARRRRLETTCPPDGFWIPQALRLVDLTTRWTVGALATHASAVAFGRHVRLFAGASGAGKSTAAGLCVQAGAHPLQDDLVFLVGDRLLGAIDWSVPDRPRTPDRVLGGICLLQQGRCSRLTPVSSREALASLAAIWGPLPGQDTNLWLERLDAVLARVPVARLEFRRDTDFVPLLARPW